MGDKIEDVISEEKDFKECPNCGCTERIIERETKKEIEAGRIKEDAIMPMFIANTIIFDPQNVSILIAKRNVPSIVSVVDACVDCGTLYVIKTAKSIALVDVQARTTAPSYNR